VARSPVADERHDRNSPRRSLSPRNCARHDSHPCGRAGAIAGKRSARAPREMPRKRRRRQERAHNYLNARTCSLRCELLTAPRLTQEISAKSRLLVSFVRIRNYQTAHASLGRARASRAGDDALVIADFPSHHAKILVHINSQLDRSSAAIKLAAGFLVWGQLCVINGNA